MLATAGTLTVVRWEDRRDNGPPPPLSKAVRARPGQTAAVLMGWFAWLLALASSWTQWYTWSDPVLAGVRGGRTQWYA